VDPAINEYYQWSRFQREVEVGYGYGDLDLRLIAYSILLEFEGDFLFHP